MIKLVVCIAAFLSLVTSTPIQQCPGIVQRENAIPDRYLVKFRDSATMDSILMATNTNTATLSDNWLPNLNIFVGEFDPDQLRTLQLNPDIEYIEQDAVFQLPMLNIEGEGDLEDELIPENPIAAPKYTIQPKTSWGLDRISRVKKSILQQPLLLEFKYRYFANVYPNRKVQVYVVDSGIYLRHDEFRGRAIWGATCLPDPKNVTCYTNLRGNPDQYGHGTLMSGVIAGKTLGVAKGANLIAVKVVDGKGSGTMESATKGLEWVIADVRAKGKGQEKIVNMSLAFRNYQPLLDAVSVLSKLNVHFVACAGNNNREAKDYSPASSYDAITVGASNIADSRWVSSFYQGSNWGAAVDLFAPGELIWSASSSSPKARRYESGTSFSAAYVSGLLAYFMTLEPNIHPTVLKAKLLSLCQKGHLTGNIGRGSPNFVAGNGINEYEDSKAQFVMDPAQIAYTMNQFGADDSDE